MQGRLECFLVKIWEINCLDIKTIRKIIKRVMEGRVQLGLIRDRGFWVYIIVSEILFACLTPSQGKAKDLLLGFKQGKQSDSLPEGWRLITYSINIVFLFHILDNYLGTDTCAYS